jgi:hypothetical protein
MAYVRQSRLTDAFELSLKLRQSDLDELAVSSHEHPLVILSRPFARPDFYQTYTILDDEENVIAMFGVSLDAVVWMLASDDLLKNFTDRFVRECRFWVDVLQGPHRVIYNYVDHRNRKSISWLKFCGFEMSPTPVPYGPFGHPFYLLYRYKEGTVDVHEQSQATASPAPSSPASS